MPFFVENWTISLNVKLTMTISNMVQKSKENGGNLKVYFTFCFPTAAQCAHPHFLSDLVDHHCTPLVEKTNKIHTKILKGLTTSTLQEKLKIQIVLNVFRSCYLNQWFCKTLINFDKNY